MHSSPNIEKRHPSHQRTATRWATNPNWTRRGDNTKYKIKK